MSIFEAPPINTAIQVREWLEFRPINQLSENSAIEFHVVPQSTGYIDLKRSLLNVKLKLTKEDGTPLTDFDLVTLVNLPYIYKYTKKSIFTIHLKYNT